MSRDRKDGRRSRRRAPKQDAATDSGKIDRPQDRQRSQRDKGGEAPQEGNRAGGKPPPEAMEAGADARQKGSGGGGSRSDGEDLKSKAWQLFLAEMAEEGIRMLDAPDAQDLAEHCFDLAEAFLKAQRRKSR